MDEEAEEEATCLLVFLLLNCLQSLLSKEILGEMITVFSCSYFFTVDVYFVGVIGFAGYARRW